MTPLGFVGACAAVLATHSAILAGVSYWYLFRPQSLTAARQETRP